MSVLWVSGMGEPIGLLLAGSAIVAFGVSRSSSAAS